MFPYPHYALPLPQRPNLENYKKIAKGLVKSGKHPTLAKAQFALARTYGFESWPKFAGHLRELARNSPSPASKPRPTPSPTATRSPSAIFLKPTPTSSAPVPLAATLPRF